MSVKFALLALLSEQPRYGAQLRAEFESRTGGTWPLNIGQVYTTLGRLQRDGLVTSDDASPDGTTPVRLTDTGRAAVATWWSEPVGRDPAPRSELAIKLALAVTLPGVDVGDVVQVQRRATLAYLQDLTRLKRSSDDADVAWLLVLENLIFTAEAEARWLDHVEHVLSRPGARRREARGGLPAEPREAVEAAASRGSR